MNAIDTNVLVYAIDGAERVKQARAVETLNRLGQDEEQLVVPWQVAGEFLACLRKWENVGRIQRADTEKYVVDFLGLLPIIFPSAATLTLSLDLSSRYNLSHWDSMLLGACIEAGVDTLYSEDMDPGTRFDGLTLVNPFA